MILGYMQHFGTAPPTDQEKTRTRKNGYFSF